MLAQNSFLISDYTFEKDALFARINLQGDELQMYYRVQEALREKIIYPDLIVYLRASTETLMQRIAFRDRPYERTMDPEYIDELNHSYEKFFMKENAKESSILTIDTNKIDIIRNQEDLQYVEDKIRQTLQLPPFQPELPIS